MPSKPIIMILFTIGSIVGGWIPALWGASFLSFTSVITGAIGGLIGIYIGYRISSD